jgi:hypothetical protein
MPRGTRNSRTLKYLCFCLVVSLALAGCANQPHPSAYDPPGFLSGLIHGFLIFFSLLGSIVLDVRIYAFPNSGFFYDLGYFIGAAACLGGGGAAAR